VPKADIRTLFDYLVRDGSKPDGTSMPSARAVWRLMTKSNLIGCKTRSSAGFDPAQNLPSVGDGPPIILTPSEILSSLDRLRGGCVDPVFEEEAQHFPRGVRSSPISE
jgi:hypothetical protein